MIINEVSVEAAFRKVLGFKINFGPNLASPINSLQFRVRKQANSKNSRDYNLSFAASRSDAILQIIISLYK